MTDVENAEKVQAEVGRRAAKNALDSLLKSAKESVGLVLELANDSNNNLAMTLALRHVAYELDSACHSAEEAMAEF